MTDISCINNKYLPATVCTIANINILKNIFPNINEMNNETITNIQTKINYDSNSGKSQGDFLVNYIQNEYINKNQLKTYYDIKKLKQFNDNDEIKKPYSICNKISDNLAIANCVISSNSPFFTLNKLNNRCIPLELKLPEKKAEQSNDKTYFTTNNELYYNKIDNKGFCEDKWYDWFTIPNYYLGNGYKKDKGIKTKYDIYKCYQSCDGVNSIPYINDNNEYKCLPKDIAEFGLYKNRLSFPSLALIYLLGFNIENYDTYYRALQDYYIFHIDSNNISINNEIKNNIFYNNINNDMHNRRLEIVDKYIIKKDDFNRANKTDKLNNFLHAESANFNEKDLLTLELLLTRRIIYEKDENKTLITAYNVMNNIKTSISDRIKQLFDINSAEPYNIRLSNILAKASNLCFDGKTEYSKKILQIIKQVPFEISLVKEEYCDTSGETYCYDTKKCNTCPESQKYDCVLKKCVGIPSTTDAYNCGNINDNDKKPWLTKKDDLNNIEAPFQNKKLPNIIQIIKYASNFILLLMILYIFYIIYETFRETIFNILNFILMFLYRLWLNIWYKGEPKKIDFEYTKYLYLNALFKKQKINTRLVS